MTPRSCGLGTRDARTWVWRRAGDRGSQLPVLVRSGDGVDTPLVTPGPQAGPAHLAVAGAPDDVSLCLHICQDPTEARGDDQNLPVTVVQLKNSFWKI